MTTDATSGKGQAVESTESTDQTAQGSAAYSEIDLADSDNQVNDTRPDTSSELLADMTIEVAADATAKPIQQLNDQTISQYADKLYDEIHQTGFLWTANPDKDGVFSALSTMSEADRKALEAAYLSTGDNTAKSSMRDDLAVIFGNDDWRKAESMLNAADNRTNDAGNLMVSLNAIDNDRADGERRVIETFATLNSTQMAQLEADFLSQYGMSVSHALMSYGVSGDAMEVVSVMRVPTDARNADQLASLANFAVEKHNLDYLSIALRGESPAAQEARESLQSNQNFLDKLALEFTSNPYNFATMPLAIVPAMTIGGLFGSLDAKDDNQDLNVAMDLVRDGTVSLSTIALNNTGSLFGWFDNKENIAHAVEGATDAERQAFNKGFELAQAGTTPANEEEKAALEFYNLTQKAFEGAGDARERALLEAKLAFGNDNFVSDIIAGQTAGDRFAALEEISKEDWAKLADTTTGPALRSQIESLVSKYADENERSKFMDMLQAKANAGSFEESQSIKRTLFEVIEQSRQDGWFFSTTYDTNAIAKAITSMTDAQAQDYMSNAASRDQIDNFVSQNLDENQKKYLQSLLKQVAETGHAAVEGPVEKVFANAMNNADADTTISDIEKLLQEDPSLRIRLLGDAASLSADDRTIKATIEASIEKAMTDTGVYRPQQYQFEEIKETAFGDLWQNGALSLSLKADMHIKDESFYAQAGNATAQERAGLLASGKISTEENQLIETIAAQAGQMYLNDKMRAAVIAEGSHYTNLQGDLRGLSDEALQELKEDYTASFGTSVEGDFLAKVEPADRETYEQLLAVGSSDGRQAFYDNLETGLRSLSGFTADGSDLTLERTLGNQGALLQDFSARFEALPQELQQKANQLFQEALEDYSASKEQFAEKLYQAAVIVGGVGLAVATGGLAVPALLAAAAVAAAGRIALKKAVQGEDYDLSLGNVLKDGAIGALTGSLSVLGPETIMALKGVGATAASTFMNVGGQALKQGIKEGSEAILQKEVNNLAGRALLTGQPITREALESLATKVAAPGTDPATLVPVLMATFNETGVKIGEQAARTLMNNVTSAAREMGSWAALGGTTNVALEGGVELANGNFDAANLPQAFITGAAFGGGIAGAFKAVGKVAPLVSSLTGAASDVPKAKFDVNTGGEWTATLDNGTVLTNDTPGPWQTQLEDGSIMRRNGNSLERVYEDGSGYVNILDGKGNARQFALVKDGMYLDAAGNQFRFYTNGELPPASSSFKFQKTAPVKAEVAEESFPWTDWQGQPMVGEAGSIKVTQPNGQISSVTKEIFGETYSPVPGKPGEFFKSAITNAQQLEADVAIPTLEGMGVGRKGDWMVTGPKGERYIIASKEFNQLYRTIETADASPIFEFRKTAVVQAEVAKEPFDWVNSNGSTMHAEAGDLRVTQPNNTISSVKPDIFAKTYEEIPGRPGEYRKSAITRAQQLNADTAVNTLEGVGTGKKGDWLVTGAEGEQYVVSKTFFDANYAPVPLTVDSPAQNYIKAMTIQAKLLTESGPFINPDAAPGTAPMTVNAGDYLAMPKGQAPYVIPGDYFQANYVPLPGLNEYGRTSITVAQVLDNEAQVWSKSAGVTSGEPGDYLITRADGSQEILSKQKFVDQFSLATPGVLEREPLSMPKATGAEIVNGNQRIQPWANGEIIRDGNSLIITDISKGTERTYVAGRLVKESQTVLDGAKMRIVTRTYPYGDIDQVNALPTLESYENLLNQNPQLRLAQELSDTTPSTHLIDTPERILLRQRIQESEWARLNELYKPEQGKTLHIILGLSGSGKSTVANEVAAKMHGMIMDADDVKPLFVDDWKDGIGAAALAREANEIEAPMIAKAMERGDNLVIPAVGAGTEHLEKLIQKAHDMGYTIDLSLVDIPPTEAMKRIVGRLEKGGMYVDPRYLASLGNVPSQNFGKLVEKYFTNSDLVSSYQRINNLNKPTLVEQGKLVGDYHNNGLTPEFFSAARVSADEAFVAPVQPIVTAGR